MTLMVLQPLFVQGPVGIEFATIRRQQAWFRVFFSVTRNPGMDVIFICTPSWHQPHRASGVLLADQSFFRSGLRSPFVDSNAILAREACAGDLP